MTQAAVRVLTPRAKAWLGRLAPLLPKDQSSQIVNSFTHHSYTSVDGIMEEVEQILFDLPGIKDLKPGAKIALRKKLAEFKVRKLGGNRGACHWQLMAYLDLFDYTHRFNEAYGNNQLHTFD